MAGGISGAGGAGLGCPTLLCRAVIKARSLSGARIPISGNDARLRLPVPETTRNQEKNEQVLASQ